MSAAPMPPEVETASHGVAAQPAYAGYDATAFRAQVQATEAQMAALEAFRALLFDWNARINLVGPSAEAEFWPRHALDSAQLRLHAPDALTFADLGAGGGLPGVVLACLLKGRDGAHVHLVESMAKRCRFLNEVVTALDLPATVHNARAEDLKLKVDVVTARACAPMVRLIGYAEPYLKAGAVGLFLKGQDVEAELKEAAKTWRFDASLHPSLSHAQGRIVELQRVARVRSA